MIALLNASFALMLGKEIVVDWWAYWSLVGPEWLAAWNSIGPFLEEVIRDMISAL